MVTRAFSDGLALLMVACLRTTGTAADEPGQRAFSA